MEWNNDNVRRLERDSIRDFVASCKDQLSGRVLDYGAGKMPYRDLVESFGAEYHAFDRRRFPSSVADADLDPAVTMQEKTWDAILVTQVLQYIIDPRDHFDAFFRWLRPGGYFVVTGKTNWAEVEDGDLMGLTVSGVRAFMEEAGFVVVRAEQRAVLDLGGFKLSLGYGAVARRPHVVIYALTDPETDEPRYVGQTTQSPRRRLRGHINESHRTSRPVALWIRDLDGATPGFRILEADPADANGAEARWFVTLTREGCDLLNLAVGNRGDQSGPRRKRPPMSAEQREKVSDYFRGRPKSDISNVLRSISGRTRPRT